MTDRPTDRLVHLLKVKETRNREPITMTPSSTYEAVTRQMVTDLAREIGELRRRIDTLFYVVVSAIIVDVLGRLLGGGWS